MSHQMHYLVSGHQQERHREARDARLAQAARAASAAKGSTRSKSVGRLVARLLSPVSGHSERVSAQAVASHVPQRAR